MIPALAFNDISTPTMNARQAGESLSRAFHKLNNFSSINDNQQFQSKTTFIEINGLPLSATSADGFVLETENLPCFSFVFPLIGDSHTSVNGVVHRYKAGSTGFLAVCQKQETVGWGSNVGLHLSPDKLLATRSTIIGSLYPADLRTKPIVIQTEHSDFSFTALLKSLFSQIDAARGDENILGNLALDDSFYRLCVGLLYPDIFLADETRNGKRPYVRPEIIRLCEYIAANLTEPISLTEMESMSGLSARILQRSFQKAYGLTPKQWLRKQRLHAARLVIVNRIEPIAITALAYDFCFASPSDFAHYYALEFGEKPSQTLGRKNLTVSAKSSVDFRK